MRRTLNDLDSLAATTLPAEPPPTAIPKNLIFSVQSLLTDIQVEIKLDVFKRQNCLIVNLTDYEIVAFAFIPLRRLHEVKVSV
jgi:hypothetical protein